MAASTGANTGRRPFNILGFRKRYNFIFFLILGGPFILFVLARFSYMNYDYYCSPELVQTSFDGAIVGECWTYSQKKFSEFGIKLHLTTVMPASALAFLQFIPVIRQRYITFHRICGYISTVLSLVGTVGALIIGSVAVGGNLTVQIGVWFIAAIFIWSTAVSIYNIQKLQLDQHRAWALRAWSYAAAIVTERPILVAMMVAIGYGKLGPYYEVLECGKIASFYNSTAEVLAKYPACIAPETLVVVPAFGDDIENEAASARAAFGVSSWLAIALHIIGVEIYLRLTPAEADRLRNISYKRQKEAGFANPGRAGLTFDSFCDAEEWIPAVLKAKNS